MGMIGTRLVAVFACLALASCARLSTYNHTARASLQHPEKSFIDAKQRAIVTVPGWKAYPTKVDATGKLVSGALEYRRVLRVCAEPSPDALSAIATSGSGGLSAKDKLTLQAAFSFAETASNIGLRTQTIQLMRDAMYRLCEAVASDNMTPAQFETLQRRFQNSMVAIVAIEQLTGTVRPASVQLSTSAALGSAKEIATLTQNAADARDKSAAADKTAADKADAVAKAETAVADAAKGKDDAALEKDDAYKKAKAALATAQDEQTKAKAAAADAKEKLAIYDTGLKAIGGGNIAVSGTATSSGGSDGGIDKDTAATVASAVKDIVSQQLELGFLREACATYFVSVIDKRIADGPNDRAATPNKADGNSDFASQCLYYAQASTNGLAAANEQSLAQALTLKKLVENGSIKTVADYQAFWKAGPAPVTPPHIAPALAPK